MISLNPKATQLVAKQLADVQFNIHYNSDSFAQTISILVYWLGNTTIVYLATHNGNTYINTIANWLEHNIEIHLVCHYITLFVDLLL